MGAGDFQGGRLGMCFEYDPCTDVVTILGTRYAGELLRTLGQQGLGSGPFRICKRADGEVIMRSLDMRVLRERLATAELVAPSSALDAAILELDKFLGFEP